MDCEHCHLSFKSKYTLKSHLSNNKTCLKLRGLEMDSKFICIACKQSCTSNINLSLHMESCKKYIIFKVQEEYELKIKGLTNNHDKEISFIKDEYNSKVKENQNSLMKKNEEYAKGIKDLQAGFDKEREAHEKTVKDLQAQIDKMFSTIENLAKQAIDKPNATTTTINTNNVKNVYSDKYFLDKLTPEYIKHKCRNYLTEQVFFQGQRGIARMCTEHIIHTKDNKVLLTCTDVSRKKFKYIDEHGNMKEDYDARAFMEKVIGPIKQVSQEVYENILSDVKYEREELEHKKDLESMERKTALHYKTDMAADCYRQIIFIDNPDDNHEFRTELAINNHS